MPRQQTATTTSHHHTPVAPAAVAKATRPSCPTLQRKVMGKWKYSLRSRGFPPQGCAHYGCLALPSPLLQCFVLSCLSRWFLKEGETVCVSCRISQALGGSERWASPLTCLQQERKRESGVKEGGVYNYYYRQYANIYRLMHYRMKMMLQNCLMAMETVNQYITSIHLHTHTGNHDD